jgi:hypothetical protein
MVMISASKPNATAPASSHAVLAGVRVSWACPIRLTVAAPDAVIDIVIGRWLTNQDASAPFSGRGGRRPTRSK